MNILLDDISFTNSLFPFGVVRSIAHIRCGILTIFEKWEYKFRGKVFIASEKLMHDFDESECIKYPANFIPSFEFLKQLCLQNEKMPFTADCKILKHPWQIFELNNWAIHEDFQMFTPDKISEKISTTNQVICPEKIFVEEGAQIHFSILNAQAGPIYIGKNAQVEEGCLLRGPICIEEGARLKMGTKIYGATTIGPYCLAGGEIKNSILTAFSNKAHDGYLGDSVIGEWCNLGAGTTNSNLKNNASTVKIWSREDNDFVAAGKKCGLLMGDYSRCAINTSFNTGTVVGICCSIFGNSFLPKFIDNFTWGNEKYIFEKAIEDISNWKKLKGHEITETEIESLKKIYQ
jgi:UDP-N-acetylglucosamine diphosphorylase / glucose-1-phosphate thymidylyltransferase / UDP-N-acetylgalactosamine diphosphorylase / glucosamine-1-phosphate N-acetyltransferase / galactosamine-1-phosphate N-acetyltransferase